MAQKAEFLLLTLALVALLALAARRLKTPYPIVVTLGGVLLGLVPGIPLIHLDPDLVFALFLPPLMYPAAVYTTWRDFRANLRPIIFLAVGLVLATMTAAAFLFHWLTGLPLAVGFVFGAIISPPDAVAALSVTRNLHVPKKIVSLLEGESLVNDATSFISFRFAVAAVMTGSFSLTEAGTRFLFVAAGGVCVGLAVGWLAARVQRRLDDPPVQTIFSLLTPYVAYFGGEELHVSGILAVVVAGMYYGWLAPRFLRGRMRLQALPVWEMVTFTLNGLLFILIGLQLPAVIRALAPGFATKGLRFGALTLSAIVLVRFTWMFGSVFLSRLFGLRVRGEKWQHTFLLSWTSIRGADSLAGALAIPFMLPDGSPFPGRDLILLLTFCIIFGTLIVQGFTLAPLVRLLKVPDDHGSELEERLARLKANEAALAKLEQVKTSNTIRHESFERLRLEYVDRIKQLRRECAPLENGAPIFSPDYDDLARQALQTERETVIELRNHEQLDNQALRRIQRDLDLAEARLGMS
jgi:CPA1 family monovalent cation:H+ antiporter